jgi:hypothetical protein
LSKRTKVRFKIPFPLQQIMYHFQNGSEVISTTREPTDTGQQQQQNSAVAITFTEIKAEEEVS